MHTRRSMGLWLCAAMLVVFAGTGGAWADHILRAKSRPTKTDPWTYYRGEFKPDPNKPGFFRIHFNDDRGEGSIGNVTEDEVTVLDEESRAEHMKHGNDALLAALRADDDATRASAIERAHRHFWLVRYKLAGARDNGADVLYGLSRVFEVKGDYEEARRLASIGVNFHRSDSRIRIQRGRMHARLAQWDEAARDFRAALAADPGDDRVAADVDKARREAEALRSSDGRAPLDPAGVYDDDGNCPEAGNYTAELMRWARESDADAFERGFLVIDPEDDEVRLDREREVKDFRARVRRATFTGTVTPEGWRRLLDNPLDPLKPTRRERQPQRVVISGWYYQLRKHYPNLPFNTVAIRIVYETTVGGRRRERVLAEASWSGEENTGRVKVTFWD